MSRPKNPPQPFVPRTRERGEAMPYAVDTRGTRYQTEKHNPPAPMRPGADDHNRYASRGF